MVNLIPHIGHLRVVVLSGICLLGFGWQTLAQSDSARLARLFRHARVKNRDGQVTIYFPGQAHCKMFLADSICFPDPRRQDVIITPSVVGAGSGARATPFLQFHGNFSYSFDYRSKLDTPFSATNFQQHQEQVYADATLKGRYPFRIFVNARQSNSPFFPNYTDANVEFNRTSYNRNLKEAMIADMTRKVRQADSANAFDRWLRKANSDYLTARSWLDNPARSQEIVQEKEKLYQQVTQLAAQQAKLTAARDSGNTGLPFAPGQLMGSRSHSPGAMAGISPDSLLAMVTRRKDSLVSTSGQSTGTENKMKQKEKEADSLYKVIQSSRHGIDSVRAREDSIIKAFAASVQSARSAKELEELGKKAGSQSMSGTDKTLLSVERFSVGRSAVNYSDLTVKNISVMGVNAEYHPSWYGAFAAGSVDYLFRDFITQPGKVPKQNLVTGRIGWGEKDRKMIIFTVYTGMRNSFGGTVTDTGSTAAVISSKPIFGYSLEGIYKLGKHTVLSGEAAKSSAPASVASGDQTSIGHAFAFSDRNNEALALKLNTSIPATQSALELFYRKIGANFQSFSVFNTGSRQESWGIKWRQYFFGKQLSLTVQIKKSNFDDPLAASGYNSSLLFKSVQAMYRRRKWPLLTLGYMPSSQLIKSSSGQVSESIYYALTANAFYSYSVHQWRMTSSLLYSRFYNRGTDSGFVLYNASNIGYNHLIDVGRLRLQTDVQYISQPQLQYWVLQQRMDITIGKHWMVGGGLKDNLVAEGGTSYWGSSLQSTLSFGKAGSLRAQYSKDYLPNGAGGLVPDNWGRIQWFKLF
jgi:hypothetical protein